LFFFLLSVWLGCLWERIRREEIRTDVTVIRMGLAMYMEIDVAIVVVIRCIIEISFIVRRGDSVVMVVSGKIVCNRR